MTATSTAPAKINVLHQSDSNINLVLIHGVYHGSWAFDEIWPAWQQLGYGIYSVDLRGRGANGGLKSSDPIGYKEHLQDTKDLLDNLSGKKILIGHSLGGLLSISLSGREDVIALVPMATPLPEVLRSKRLSLLFKYPLKTFKMLFTRDAAVFYHDKDIARFFFFTGASTEQTVDYIFEKIRVQNEPYQLFDDLNQLSFEQLTCTTPALVVYGEFDPTVDRKAALKVNEIVNGSLCQIPEAGHDFMIEKRSADSCARQITNWLNESSFLC
jgi:pimeloyl-ACP methyl ester carboxylesterase